MVKFRHIPEARTPKKKAQKAKETDTEDAIAINGQMLTVNRNAYILVKKLMDVSGL